MRVSLWPPAGPRVVVCPSDGCENPCCLLAQRAPSLPFMQGHGPAACTITGALFCSTFVAASRLCRGVDVMDLLVTLTTKQGVALLNSTQVGRQRGNCIQLHGSIWLACISCGYVLLLSHTFGQLRSARSPQTTSLLCP